MKKNNMFSGVCAVVVAHFPNAAKILSLINVLTHSLDLVIIVNNGGFDESTYGNLFAKNVSFIDPQSNIGVGSALNEAFSFAKQVNMNLLFTFDQDSAPELPYISSMISAYVRLKSTVSDCGCLTPIFFDSRDKNYTYKEIYESGDNTLVGLEVLKVTLQSGLLIPLNVWEHCKFNEELFIEYVDTDWCYRINSMGYRIYQVRNISMSHEVSDLMPVAFFCFLLLKYSPVRRYYFFRNSIFILRQTYVPFNMKLRTFTGMLNRFVAILLLDDNKLSSFLMSFKGLCHGVIGRFGKK